MEFDPAFFNVVALEGDRIVVDECNNNFALAWVRHLFNNDVVAIKDSIVNHLKDPGVEQARPQQSEDRTFSPKNRHLYYNKEYPPLPTSDGILEKFGAARAAGNGFVVL